MDDLMGDDGSDSSQLDFNMDALQTLGTRSYTNLMEGAAGGEELKKAEEQLQTELLLSKEKDSRYTAPSSKQGYLFKESKNRKDQWKRCWFAFDGSKCAYHKRDKRSPVAGTVEISDILSCRVTNKRSKHFCFVLAVENKGLYYLAADSYDDLKEWMVCLSPKHQGTDAMDQAGSQVVEKIEQQNHELHLQKEKLIAELERLTRDRDKIRVDLENAEKEVTRLDTKDQENTRMIADLNAKVAMGQTNNKSGLCTIQ